MKPLVRNNKELLMIIRNEIAGHSEIWKKQGCMCGVADMLYKQGYINELECGNIEGFIRLNNPQKKNPKDITDYGYWFNPWQKEPRLEWIDHNINELETANNHKIQFNVTQK